MAAFKIKIGGLFLALIVIFLTVVLAFLAAADEEGVSLQLSPSAGSFLAGSTFTVSVVLNTHDLKINTVDIKLKFPPELLQVASPIGGNSFISEWSMPPSYSNESGLVSFKGGVPEGIVTSAGLVATITFRAAAIGKAKIEITGDSKVLLHDGKGTNALNNIINSEQQILLPPPEGPKAVSITHPDSAVWYSDATPSFAWEKEEGVEGYSWLFNQNPQSRPDGLNVENKTSVSFSSTKDGIWYFHIKQKKSGVWSKATDVAVKIDTTPPQDFTPKVQQYSKLGGDEQAIISFETKDNLSGLAYYKVSVVYLDGAEQEQSFIAEATSPYKINLKTIGSYMAVVQAIDKAGNIKEVQARFTVSDKQPWWLIRGPWFWVTAPVGIIFLVGLLILGIRLHRRKRKNKLFVIS